MEKDSIDSIITNYENGNIDMFFNQQKNKFLFVKSFLIFLGEKNIDNKNFFFHNPSFYFNILIKIEKLFNQDQYNGNIRLSVFFESLVRTWVLSNKKQNNN